MVLLLLKSKFGENLNQLTARRFFNQVEWDQLPFMERIILKSSYPGTLKSYSLLGISTFYNPSAIHSCAKNVGKISQVKKKL